MAKESMKAREVKRAKTVAKYAEKRKALKEAGDYDLGKVYGVFKSCLWVWRGGKLCCPGRVFRTSDGGGTPTSDD
jgi:hypothetical protein